MLTHHAYYVEGEAGLLPEIAEAARKEMKLPKGSPDVTVQSFERFGIDESRQLRNLASLKTLSGGALFAIAATSITTEAQQALLKLFEEPQRGVIFVLLVPHGTLLSTLRSRCLLFPIEQGAVRLGSAEAKTFLKAGYKERTTQIAELLDEEGDVRARAREFLGGLEGELYRAFEKSRGEKKNELASGLEDIGKLRGYLSDRSTSLKMLLEHLAAALPRV
ncbi:MAG: hypothetical protein KGJ34_02270 [Patescibacteria group bacterium]|nr:hypothetical protein [Patescibacteria group bacterium]